MGYLCLVRKTRHFYANAIISNKRLQITVNSTKNRKMRSTILLFILIGQLITVHAQESEGTRRTTLTQIGYIHEYNDASDNVLQGGEMQIKLLFAKDKVQKGEPMKESGYFNIGYAFFPGNGYNLGKVTGGFGIITDIFSKKFFFDTGINASYYHGSIGDNKFTGKTVDLGGHIGVSYVFNGATGIYSQLAMPGIISTLIDDNYISPILFKIGLQF